jgi:peptidoglycan/LPS O-acetylase OafA/YrhL
MKKIEESNSPSEHLHNASQKLYFPALDGLRFFAFLLVFIHHLPRSTEPILALLHDQGWVGVHVFLFLSAYLLTAILRAEQHVNGAISIKKFYIRRGLRIWPLYFVFCVCAFVLSNFLRPHPLPIEWFRFGGLMAFVDNIITGFRGYNPISYTAHLWTISLEEQFYLVLPLLLAGLLAVPTRLLRGLFACWLLFLAIRIIAVLLKAPHPMIWTSVFSADSLLLGTALGAMRPSPPSTVFMRVTIVIVGIFALFSGVFLPPIDKVGVHQVIVYSLIAVGAAALTTAALHEPLLRFLKERPLRYLGKISYGLYVFHVLGIAVGSKVAIWIGSASWWVGALTAFAATTILSVLSYELFERQFLKLKQRFESVQSRPI